MRELRTNTAVLISVGPFYDKTDGVTIETALTITNERITLVADTDDNAAPTNILDNVTGATSGTSNDLNYITGNDAGIMQMELSAANVNRLGRMLLSITDAANHVPVFHEFMVINAGEYDYKYALTGACPGRGIIGRGTMQAGSTSTSAVLASATSYADDFPNGSVIEIVSGTGAGQARFVDDWVNSTDTATISPAWTTTPDNTSIYVWWASPPASTGALLPVKIEDIGTTTTVAANLKKVVDTTGITLTGVVIPLTTDITTKTGYRLSSTGVDDILRTALTESYAADGAAGTLSQILFAIQAFLQEKAVSGTTLTVKKLDGSTTAMTFTLSDASNPTSLTRAS